MPLPLLALAPLVLGSINAVSGLVENGQGKALQRNNVRPKFNQSGMYDDLVSMYSAQAQYGIDPNSLSFARDNNAENLTAGINGLVMAGGDPNMISSMFTGAAKANNDLAIKDSDRRWAKVQAVGGAIDKLYDAKKEEFLYNEDGPYKDAAKLAAAKIAEGNKKTMSGLDMIGGGLTKAFGSNSYDTPDVTTVKAPKGGTMSSTASNAMTNGIASGFGQLNPKSSMDQSDIQRLLNYLSEQ